MPDEIFNLDKLTYAGNLESLKDLKGNPHYHFIRGDICNSFLLDKVVADIDWIIHLAAESHVDRSLSDSGIFVKTNVMGSYFLLGAALKHKVSHFHHVSTDEVFGALPLRSRQRFNEETKFSPRSPYSASKASADHFTMAFYHSFGLPVTIGNCSDNYGPYQYLEKFIPRMITNLIEGKKIVIYGDGKYVRDWLYVEDYCRAIELILLKGKPGESYCVGGCRKEINNLQLAELVLRLIDKDKSCLQFVSDRPGHDRRYAVNWSKVKRELGWQSEHDLEIWLGKTVQRYREDEWWWRPLKKEAGDFYQRLNKKKAFQ